MELKYYFNSNMTPIEAPANAGHSEALKLLNDIEKKGKAKVERIDTVNLSEAELFEIYSQAGKAAVYRGYDIAGLFRGARRRRLWFGSTIPALLVYEEDDSVYPTDTYPHKEGDQMKTILDGLLTL